MSELLQVQVAGADPERKIVSDGAHTVGSRAKSKHLLQDVLVRSPSQDLVWS